MPVEAWITLTIAAAAVILFVTERIAVELTALIVLVALVASGILTVDESLAGFSNPATLTVAAMFVLSAGLYRTGAVDLIGRLLTRIGRRSFWLSATAMMLIIALISSVVNNTAAVAVFLPVAITVCRQTGASPSRLLMPLSFAGIMGGMCSLLGTSTNILVAGIASSKGVEPFGLFEFARVGVPLAVFGIVYMLTIGVRILPKRRTSDELTESYDVAQFLTEVVVSPDSTLVGRTLADNPLTRDIGMDVIEVWRGEQRVPVPAARMLIQGNDVLIVRCSVDAIRRIQQEPGLALRPHVKWSDADFLSQDAVLLEAVIAPNSPLVGTTLKGARFRNRFGSTVLALRHEGQVLYEKLSSHVLKGGDSLLIEARRDHLPQLRDSRGFVFVNSLEMPHPSRAKMIPAVAIVALVVIAAATGIVPIVVSALAGCVAMALLSIISLEEAYRSVEWRVIVLLAGILPLGVALQKSGAAAVISRGLLDAVEPVGGAIAVISALYLLTSILTEMMSNNASAALLAPIAIVTAETLGLDPRPFLFAVAFGASASFMTPVGYQTNTMVYGPGGYRFSDFVRVGLPLNLAFWLLATWLIPLAWPPNPPIAGG